MVTLYIRVVKEKGNVCFFFGGDISFSHFLLLLDCILPHCHQSPHQKKAIRLPKEPGWFLEDSAQQAKCLEHRLGSVQPGLWRTDTAVGSIGGWRDDY